MTPTETTSVPRYSAQQVADFFLAVSNSTGEPITNLRLQKLVFYAQAWHLANFKTPLFEEDFQAWIHGPVIPALYRGYKENGSKPIVVSDELTTDVALSVFDSRTQEYLKEVANVYMKFNTWELENMTHIEDPWKSARGDLPIHENSEKVISKDSITAFYGAKLSEV